MRPLTWVLLAIAAVLLIALYLYGKWQERKSAGLDHRNSDLDAETIERPLPDRASLARTGRNARNTAQTPVRIEPTMGPSPEPSPSSELLDDDEIAATQRVGGWIEDALLDVMLELRCAHSFDGVAALEARAPLERPLLPPPRPLAACL